MRLIVVLLLFVFSGNSIASDFLNKTVEPKVTKPKLIKSLVVDDIPSVVFDEEFARKLLKLRLDYPVLKEKIDLQAALIVNLKAQNKVYSDITIILSDSNKELSKTNVVLAQKIRDFEVWYKSNVLWFFIGFIVATGATTAIVISVK